MSSQRQSGVSSLSGDTVSEPTKIKETGLRTSQSTPQNAGTWDAFLYIVTFTIGTGIFSVPSSIFAVTGSVGITLCLWLVGGLFMACAVCIFIEFGAALPRSGGEKNYLERIFRKPKYLITCVMASVFLLFGGMGPSSIAFGSYLLHAAGYENATGIWATRLAAFGCVTFCVLLHSFLPKWGLMSIKLTAYFKLGLMIFIIISGIAALAGAVRVPNPHNFDNMFTVEVGDGYGSGGLHGYARALMRLGFVYGGAVSVTYILGEFRDPRKVLFTATPLALITVIALYLLVNIAYFAAIPRSQFAKSDAIVAATFFENMFGRSAATRVLPALIAVSNLGSILAATFSRGRINQELAKEGILPFGHFWSSNKPCGAPSAAMLLCWLSSIVMIFSPPPGPIYSFLIDLLMYPYIFLATLATGGLLYLRFTPSENWSSPYKAPLIVIFIYLVYHLFLMVMVFVAPESTKTPEGLPYYAAPVAGICILLLGILYWILWAQVWPPLCGYRIETTRIEEEDGRETVEFRKVWRNAEVDRKGKGLTKDPQ